MVWQHRQQSSGFGGQAVEAGYTNLAKAQAAGYNVSGQQQAAAAAATAAVAGGGFQQRPGGGVLRGQGGMDRPRQNNPNYERPTVDCNSAIVRTLESRVFETNGNGLGTRGSYLCMQPDMEYMRDLVLPQAMGDNPSNAYCTHHCHTAVNREKFPIYCTMWTPEGR